MKKLILLIVHVSIISFVTLAQQTPQKLEKIISQNPDNTFLIIEKEGNDTVIMGTLLSSDPEIRNGEFLFYKTGKTLIAKGVYENDIPTGTWNYYNEKGKINRTLNYDKTKVILEKGSTQPKDIYYEVDDMPIFDGKSNSNFRDYIQENLIYPVYSIQKHITGTVMVGFTIDENGFITNVNIAKSSGHSDLDMEALRVVSESPKWKPGKHKNVKVPVSFTFPIVFKL